MCYPPVCRLVNLKVLSQANLHGRSLQGPRSPIPTDTRAQYLFLGVFLYFICESSLLVYRNYQIHSTCTHSYMSLFKLKFILKQSQNDGEPNFIYALFQLPKRSVSSLASSTPSKPNNPLCIEVIQLAEIHI